MWYVFVMGGVVSMSGVKSNLLLLSGLNFFYL